ncbi:MAG: hypothetical protein KatS3mg076_1218 [Candidatus Binatia bacterium]|nr:MAG: hypothetical protein KatS3mg076_1218 [Candidatus Binatia bacterium]
MKRPAGMLLLCVLLSFSVWYSGCGGCQEPELAPPGPVEGRLPAVRKGPPGPVTPATHQCGVLAIPSTEEGKAPLVVHFTAEGDCTKGEPLFRWSFGDGSPPAEGPAVLHTFERPGEYEVSVEVRSSTDPELADRDEVEIRVTGSEEGKVAG